MMTRTGGKLNGAYLLTENEHIFSSTPEIFVLLEEDGNIRAICLNQPFRVKDALGAEITTPASSYLSEIFFRAGKSDCLDILASPVLHGGPNGVDQIEVLHTGYEGALGAKEYLKNRYYISNVPDFVSSIQPGKLPRFACIFIGSSDLNQMQVAIACSGGSWKVERGQDYMTYGGNPERKLTHWGTLRMSLEKPPSPKIEGEEASSKFVGDLIEQLKRVGMDFMLPMMSSSIFLHLNHTTDLSYDKIIEITRALLAVSEREASDINQVMNKYTHTQLIMQARSIHNDGVKLRLLESYDLRRAMLIDLGLNHIAYDLYEANLAQASLTQAPSTATRKSNRATSLAKSIDSLAQLIKKQ